MKDAFKQFMKGSKKKAQAPRATEDINKEYTSLCSNLGHAQYRLKVLETDIQQILNRMGQIDFEAGERRKLDEASKAAQAKVVQSSASQNSQDDIKSGAV